MQYLKISVILVIWLDRRKIRDIMSKENFSNIVEIIKDGNITTVPEFYAGSCHSGIRKWKDDLSIIFTPLRTTTSAVFTTNKFAAAPIKVDKWQLKKSRNINAIVINSGISNACTGKEGYLNALETVKIAAENLDIGEQNVLVSSTGRIGVQLPMEKIKYGIEVCSKNLTRQGGGNAAKAILTIDKKTKEIAVKLKDQNPEIIIGGIAKGSVMIEPNMATTLAFLTTNVKISIKLLDKLLKDAVSVTFNCLTTDGCQSTNDMIVAVANAQSGVDVSKNNKLLRNFKTALYFVLESLTKKVAEDAEGVTKIIEIEVINSKSIHTAKNIGKKVANSLLFKTAMFGQDLNWGRIVAAIGSEGSNMDQEKIDLYFGDELIMKKGSKNDFDKKKTAQMMRDSFLRFKVDLNSGNFKAKILTNDITYDYIKMNAEYKKQR